MLTNIKKELIHLGISIGVAPQYCGTAAAVAAAYPAYVKLKFLI
jgi:hypothetical protein